MTTVEVLRKARELVARPGGWRQGEYGNAERCCAEGALYLAGGIDDPNDSMDLYPPAYDELKLAIGVSSIIPWNDAPGRTQAEVVAAFDRAIALAEAADAR